MPNALFTREQQRFLNLTHCFPDYFLGLVGHFLDPWVDKESLADVKLEGTIIRFINDQAKTTAMVRFTEDSIVITKEPTE